MGKRIEKDTMGEIAVPGESLYGAHTARAVENFAISGQGIGREMIRALGLIKHAAALVNQDLGKLDPEIAQAIARAGLEVAKGDLDDHFPVDLFQTGSGTSSNMNANEVIANRAIQLLGGTVGSRSPVHPNDHVNMGQSSNDVFPTAIHVAALTGIEQELKVELARLGDALTDKSEELDDIVKIGRTHLQDATPIRLGQEFSGFVSQVVNGLRHIQSVSRDLRELAIGGTAVGTGLNTHPEFGKKMALKLSSMTSISFAEASNHFEAQSARDAIVRTSGALKSVAVSLIKIANDIRWLGSGPRLGLGELKLPAVQPGSSIMPGKVNPVIAESLIQASVQVIGNDTAIATAGLYGNFQLNAMQPLMARNLLEQIRLLTKGTATFTDKLVAGLEPNRDRIASSVEQSLSLATALAPRIGYDRASAIAKRADVENRTVREIAKTERVLPDDELTNLLDLMRQTEPD
ncbi:MAG: class II fumarate hydratase [Proteobacteria bacterium]|nr:class II fumarate hydratase [Pseudomonadota bacterium]